MFSPGVFKDRVIVCSSERKGNRNQSHALFFEHEIARLERKSVPSVIDLIAWLAK